MATGASFDAGELYALALDLAAAPAHVAAKNATALRRSALAIERDAKVSAPVDTGYLKSSITSDIRPTVAEVGPEANYGIYVEYGTSRMSPQPFLGPAFEKNVGPFERAVADNAGDLFGRSLTGRGTADLSIGL